MVTGGLSKGKETPSWPQSNAPGKGIVVRLPGHGTEAGACDEGRGHWRVGWDGLEWEKQARVRRGLCLPNWRAEVLRSPKSGVSVCVWGGHWRRSPGPHPCSVYCTTWLHP